jgi:hypothetical protein
MFISKRRQHIISDHIWGAPDLVVEVMSPHPRIGKLDERIGHFSQYGRRRMFRGAAAIESAVLPDFRISPEVLSCW